MKLPGVNFLSRNRPPFFVALVLVAAFFVAVKTSTRFFVGLNDFWGLLFYARHLSWSEKASLYNGFYPVGYALLLRLFPYSYVIQFASLTNAFFAGLLAASVLGLVWSARSRWAAMLACLSGVLFPLTFQYSLYLVPDIGSAALTAFAVFLLFRQELNDDPMSSFTGWQYGLAGIALGLASLWRSHAILSSLAILAVYSFFGCKTHLRRYGWILAVSFFVVAGVQPLINLISGHGVFETAQKFNLYKTFYGIDWVTPPDAETLRRFSVFQALMDDPGRFLSIYFRQLSRLLRYALIPLIGLFLSSNAAAKRFFIFAILTTTLYSLPVAAGGSSRSPLPLMGIVFSALGLLFASLIQAARQLSDRRLTGVLFASMAVLAVLGVGYWGQRDLRLVRKSASIQTSLLVLERILVKHGLTSANAGSLYENFARLYESEAEWSDDNYCLVFLKKVRSFKIFELRLKSSSLCP